MSELVKKAYDERAETYDKEFENNLFRICDAITWKYLEPYLPKNKDAVVLDAGGGTGRWSIPMAKTGLNVVLVDISEGMLNVARRKIREADLEDKITVKQGDITKLEYPDETFDLVFCEHALFLIEEQVKAIRELTRILKKGDPLVISCPNVYIQSLHLLKNDFPNLDNVVSSLNSILAFTEKDEGRFGVKRGWFLTPIEFRKILENNGLKVEKIVGKVITFLGVPEKFRDTMSQDLLQKLLGIEMSLCEREDALGLAIHLQAIAYKE